MSTKTFLFTAGVFFALVTILHVSRIVFGWEAVINGLTIPFWASYAGVVVSGFLSYFGLKLSRGY